MSPLKSHAYMINWVGEDLMMKVCVWMVGIKCRLVSCEGMNRFIRIIGSKNLLWMSRGWDYRRFDGGFKIL